MTADDWAALEADPRVRINASYLDAEPGAGDAQ